MISSLKSLKRRQLFNSFSVCFKWITTNPSNIRKSFKTDSVINKLIAKNVLQTNIVKRFQSTQQLIKELKELKELKPKERPKNVDTNIKWSSGRVVFVDNENQMAFSVIENSLNQQKFELNEEKPEINPNCDEIVDRFLNISPVEFRDNHSSIVDLCKVVKYLSLKQLSDVLQSVSKWNIVSIPFDPLFYKAWSNVDQELVNRLNKINFSDNNQVLVYLFLGNLFYKLKVANISKFNYNLVKKLCSPDFQLNEISFIHLMFYANLHRNIDNKYIPFLMKTFENLINKMTLNEIGVICMSLFKTGNPLTEDLVKQLIFRTLTDISEETHNIIRTAITKCIRKSYRHELEPQIKQYLDEMKKLSNNSDQTLTHLVNLKTTAHVFDQSLMNIVLDKVWSDPTAFRIKDIERILLCFAHFESKLDLKKVEYICNELDSKSDFFQSYRYPICLLNINHYLAILGVYSKPLIQHCFEPNFLSKIIKYSKLDYQRHLLVTNTALSIEMYDEYKDILIPPEKVYRYHRWILNEEKSTTEYITKRMALLNSIYMSLQTEVQKRVQLCHIFPFRSYPLVVIFDDQNKRFSFTANTELKANMFNNCVVIYIADIQDFAIIDTMIKGSIRLELRLLEGMGFKVVFLTWHQLTYYSSSTTRKNKIIAEILNVDPTFKL